MICNRITVRGHGITVPCASLRPCPTHDAAQVPLSDHGQEEAARAFEQGLTGHDANALNAWRARTGQELRPLPMPAPLEQEVLFG